MNFYTPNKRGRIKQLLLVMKLTTLFIILACFKVSATVAQTITLNAKNAPLSQVLKQIEKQSGYSIFYENELLKTTNKVSINLNNSPLKDALDKCLNNQPLTYEIVDNTVVIKKKDKTVVQKIKEFLAPPVDIRGKVTDEKGQPLPGVTIRVKKSGRVVLANDNGEFQIEGLPDNSILVFSFIGYASKEVPVNSESKNLIVSLVQDVTSLKEVTVSTGYQEIPKERATGSFVELDNAILNRRVSTNIIDRLDGITSGLSFNGNFVQRYSNDSPYNIRGLSTIFANTKPLIIVDSFPFDGDISNLNPNDVESVTVLKDAAAASIWGARSGNGVIVITTKKGRYNSQQNISFNSNFTYTQKPNIYYGKNFLDASDFIDAEQFLFNNGYFNSNLNSTTTRPLVSPVVEILASQRSGTITAAQANTQIDALRKLDIRDDLSKYLYRGAASQQYALNLSGGNTTSNYYISAGYDKVPSVLTGNSYDRKTINSLVTIVPLKNFEISGGLTYTLTNSINNNFGTPSPGSGKAVYYPYAQLADESGNALALPKDYRYNYISGLGTSQLLDWSYRPLQELAVANNTSGTNYFKFNTSLKYRIISGLSIDVKYQLEKQSIKTSNDQTQDSYYTRNQINLNTQVSGTTVTRPVPLGNILDQSTDNLTGNSIRAQINFNKQIAEKHELTAIAGIDGKELIDHQNTWRLYSYNDLIGTTTAVDYNTNYTKYSSLTSSGKIPYLDKLNTLTDEYFSYFANASYTYNKKYILSGSARFDQSNLFGVTTNQKGVPLWSTGLAWDISKESFYNVTWLPYLKLRATYGYNGNIDKTVSAFTTALFATGAPVTGLPYVNLQNPPNPELRWERIGLFNVGLDFSTKNELLSGSFEYYHKKGSDIIGFAPVDPTTGVTKFKGNAAAIEGSGIDIDLTLKMGNKFRWIANLLLSKATDKVIGYSATSSLSTYLQLNDGSTGSQLITPVVGKPIFSVYGYKWAGLDPINGDPQGYLNGQVSKDYSTIGNSTNIGDAVYKGSARPTTFGAFRNDFYYYGLTLSVNITYKLGYYFRRPSIVYSSLAGGWAGNADYISRWQKPGDESQTNVPSFTYPLSTARENFYQYSEIMIEKGDHVRLQDIQLSYDFRRLKDRLHLKSLQLYGYANNLGIIWKANKAGIDPDFITNTYVNPKTFSLGLRTSF